MQCRSYSAQLGRHNDEFKAADTQVLIILGDPLERARKYVELLKLPFPVLADPSRKVYHRYGLQKAAVLIQRTATVLLDKEGVIRYQKRVTNPMTWLQDNVELRQAVRELNALEV
jgi:peroxiredoxin